MTPLTIVCAWCNAVLRRSDNGSRVISHGICPACSKELLMDVENVGAIRAAERPSHASH